MVNNLFSFPPRSGGLENNLRKLSIKYPDDGFCAQQKLIIGHGY